MPTSIIAGSVKVPLRLLLAAILELPLSETSADEVDWLFTKVLHKYYHIDTPEERLLSSKICSAELRRQLPELAWWPYSKYITKLNQDFWLQEAIETFGTELEVTPITTRAYNIWRNGAYVRKSVQEELGVLEAREAPDQGNSVASKSKAKNSKSASRNTKPK